MSLKTGRVIAAVSASLGRFQVVDRGPDRFVEAWNQVLLYRSAVVLYPQLDIDQAFRYLTLSRKKTHLCSP